MISPSELLAPAGDLLSSHFPGELGNTLDERIQGYISEAAALATSYTVDASDLDNFVKAWAYHRAYRAIHARMVNDPSTVVMDGQGQASTLWSQIDAMKMLSAEWLAKSNDLIPPESFTAPQIIPPSGAAFNQFGF